MPIHHQDKQVIANAVPSRLGGFEEPNDLGLGEEILPPFVRVCGRGGATLYISPVGRPRPHRHNPLTDRFAAWPAFDRRLLLSKVPPAKPLSAPGKAKIREISMCYLGTVDAAI
jgi:hypothetical protein